MTLKNWALCATILTYFAGAAQVANAQNALPVNFPPADYQGRQFVDNAGCIFVRAGFDGAVNWVPRVTRSRDQICGQTPTFGATRTAGAAAPAPRSNPTQITLETRPAATVAAPAPQPVVRTAASTPAPRRVVAPAPAPAPVVIKAPASKPIAAEPPRVVRRVPQVAAPAATTTVRIPTREACAAGQAYRVVNGKRMALRCGPQQGPVVPVVRRGEAPAPGKNVHYNRSSWNDSALSPDTRIVPRHLYEQKEQAQIAHIPAGYKPAWTDDRLNPHRAVQTVQGYMDTQQVWTNELPRRLVSAPPAYVPFPKNLWTAKYRHQVTGPNIAYRANERYPPADVQVAYADQAQYRTAVMSSRGDAQADTWVEIGVFTTDAKAQAAAARLASAGVAVKAAVVSHNGSSAQRLRVGPFASTASAQGALNAIKGAGYVQAYIR